MQPWAILVMEVYLYGRRRNLLRENKCNLPIPKAIIMCMLYYLPGVIFRDIQFFEVPW